MRLGFRQVRGLREDDMQVLVSKRLEQAFHRLLNYGMQVFHNLFSKNSPMQMHLTLLDWTEEKHCGKSLRVMTAAYWIV